MPANGRRDLIRRLKVKRAPVYKCEIALWILKTFVTMQSLCLWDVAPRRWVIGAGYFETA